MKKVIKNIVQTLTVIIGVLAVATLKGTTLWLTFPFIHILFPTALKAGILPADLTWWQSVCLAWLFSSIIPARHSGAKKTKKITNNNQTAIDGRL